MKRFILLMLLINTSFVWATPNCDYHMSVSNATVQIENSAQMVQQTITLSRGQNSPDGRCKLYRLFFSKGLANNYQRKAFNSSNQSLDYNLHRNINQAGILKDYNDAVSSNEFLEGTAPDKFTIYTSHFFVAAPGNSTTMAYAGTYSDVVQVTIYGYNENSGNYLFDETQNLTLLFFVAKKVQLSLVEEGSAFDASATSKTLDFGVLAQNQEKGADLRVLSNGGYQLKVSSQNNGVLKNNNESVSYTLKVNGTFVALTSSASSPVQIGSGSATSQAGDLYNLKIKITENPQNKSAGLYQDVITVTAIAN